MKWIKKQILKNSETQYDQIYESILRMELINNQEKTLKNQYTYYMKILLIFF